MVSDEMLSLLTKDTNQPLLANMGEPGGEARYGQGRILSWNPDTFENAIAYRGAVINNMPVLSGPDALTYREDDVVAVMSFSPNRGATVYWIMGRVIVPGPGKAAETIEWMTGELGRAIAASVFADRIGTDFKTVQIQTASDGTYQDGLFGGNPDPGPTVTKEVTERGEAIVLLSARVASTSSTIGEMSFDVSGATTISAPFAANQRVFISNAATTSINVSSAAIAHVSGLNPGENTFQAKYKSTNTGPGTTAWSERSMTVIAF